MSNVKERRYPRVRFPEGLLLAWRSCGRHEVSRATVLSAGGMFVPTRQPVPVGSIVQLILKLPKDDVRMLAAVRNVPEGHGMGMEIISMHPVARGRLKKFVAAQREMLPTLGSLATN